ncbi:hypothetical protein BC936DRAFT_143773, partial [Jimgerdemannia flammicorona]
LARGIARYSCLSHQVFFFLLEPQFCNGCLSAILPFTVGYRYIIFPCYDAEREEGQPARHYFTVARCRFSATPRIVVLIDRGLVFGFSEDLSEAFSDDLSRTRTAPSSRVHCGGGDSEDIFDEHPARVFTLKTKEACKSTCGISDFSGREERAPMY